MHHVTPRPPTRSKRTKATRAPRPRWRWLLAAIICVAGLQPKSPVRADEPPRARKDFRGVWAGDGSTCRSPDEFLLIYERRTASFPYRSSLRPDRVCRILSIRGKYPEWRLRLSCRHPDPKYHLPKPFEMHQTLRMLDGGYRMIVTTEPVQGQPAYTEDTFFCRKPGDPMPKMICFSVEKGHSVPCEP